MSAELEHNKSMAYVGETPWHGLGVKVEDGISAEGMMRAAGLDWTVSKRPIFFETPNGERKNVKDKFVLARDTDDHVLDTVGPTYKPVQNAQVFDFFHDFVAAAKMKMDTAGSLKQGRHIWALASIEKGFELKGGDQVNGYLLFHNPHQWGKALQVLFTPIRVVCNNTLTAALRGASDASGRYRNSHATTFSVETAKEALGLANDQLDEFRKQAEYLASRRATKDDTEEYFTEVLAKDSHGDGARLVVKAMEALEYQPGAEMSQGSWWSNLNAVTYLFDHKLGRSQDSRLASSWFGARQNTKQEAMVAALRYAKSSRKLAA